MKNRDRFFEAFAHTRHRVMGRWLARFSLRHRFWLEAMNSPVVEGGRIGLVDLEMATRICAVPFAKLDRMVPEMLERGPGIFDKIGFFARAWRRESALEYRKFQDYMTDHGCPPATHASAPVSQSGKVYEDMPGLLGLATALVRASGWEPDTVWALTPGEAEWWITGIFTHRGVDMQLVTAHDEEFMEGIRKMREQKTRLKTQDCKTQDSKEE